MRINRAPQTLIFKGFCSLLLVVAGVSCHAALVPLYTPMSAPQNDLACTSTREVRTLLLHGNTLWAGTSGGVLRRDAAGAWQKFTTREGLPANEVRSFRIDEKGAVIAHTPRGAARWENEKWRALPDKPEKGAAPKFTPQAKWREMTLQAALDGLHVHKVSDKSTTSDASTAELRVSQTSGSNTQDSSRPTVEVLALPDGIGSHISALLPRQNDVVVALFGDGLWLTDGKRWQRAPAHLQVPAQATEITALAGSQTLRWMGTRRDGLWQHENASWKQHLQSNEPFEHNAQAVQEYKGAIFVSTLEDGLVIRTGKGWKQAGLEFLSSLAPRQMVEFAGKLFVRHGGGAVDQCDGFAWRKDLFSALPRRKVLALAGDKERLYLGQWGGWSEWDGERFVHHLNIAELQGLPPMTLLADGEKLWFATQSRGLAEVDRASGKVRWHDERHGLPDDWITCLLKVEGEMFAGTFRGGLSRWDGARWHHVRETHGENVTSLSPDGEGGLFIATRHGVWRRSAAGKMALINEGADWIEPEAQALYRAHGGLWIGTRTGVFYLRSPSGKL